MDDTFEPKDRDLFAAFCSALEASVVEAARQLATGKRLDRKRDWPRLGQPFDNGLPSFSYSSGFGDGPVDYGSVVHGFRVDAEVFPWFREFRDFCRQHPRVSRFYARFALPDPDEIFKITIAILLGDLLDAYIHGGPLPPHFEIARASELYNAWERLLFLDRLPLNLVVPLLCLRCDFEDIEFSDRVGIVKLTEQQQLARMAALRPNYSISSNQETLLGAATHALVLAGWVVQKQETELDLLNVLASRSAYDVSQVDDAFCALRLVCPGPFGYGQIAVAPWEWLAKIRGELPPWEAHPFRGYPVRFEDGQWRADDIPTLTHEMAEDAKRLFLALTTSTEGKFRLARARINFAALRDSEEDAVIDATIALEALLASDSTQEMTHKLALRVGALSRLANYHKRPSRVFQEIKKIYGYRSAVVHGQTKANHKREIRVTHGEPVTAVVAAEEYAKLVMRLLLENPDLRLPETVDTNLLLGDSGD